MRHVLIVFVVTLLLLLAGCSEPDYSDYGDAPDGLQDGSLDYQDYKEAGCPYLKDSLDHETMQKCNEWYQTHETEASGTTSTEG